MSNWIAWMIAAGLLVVVEMFVGTFYLLMIGVGLAAAGLVALAGASGSIQILTAAVVGVIATYLLRRSRFGRKSRTDAARDPNVIMDIGESVRIDVWDEAGDGTYTTRAKYRGTDWDVQLLQGVEPHPGTFVIREVRGNRLIVSDHRQ
ncbi:MAG TPA: NfeD family protein [Noviherbaspirillum sp.]|jgi:membrane protein implicated in regulation of membrane protease activity|uniref:NfeD family protein n=1 Tax=Noviherbaspirillum sp. TaxID=1926288 RepID=UPI002DDD6CE7|nr:NfeD family protein [Noviherbaspirillum sp.]HEV2611259.1 NfeD family protein [Noviherbaspirillum sp.]